MIKKLSFPEKNRLLHQLLDESLFDKDYELFKRLCPQSRLHNELGRARFGKSALYSRMLFELLDVASPEDIRANRGEQQALFANEEAATAFVNAYFSTDEDEPLALPENTLKALMGCKTREEAETICKRIENFLPEAVYFENAAAAVAYLKEFLGMEADASLEVPEPVLTQLTECGDKESADRVCELFRAMLPKVDKSHEGSDTNGKDGAIAAVDKDREDGDITDVPVNESADATSSAPPPPSNTGTKKKGNKR